MKLPTYFISHGGGPWPWIPQMRATMRALEESLVDIPRQLGATPDALLVVSGHWEDPRDYVVMAGARPPMIYDYGGFPAHTYQVSYPAAGDPALAARTHDLIAAAGLPTRLDAGRGFDHGVFSPLAVMYPAADVPVYQVSMRSHLQPAEHLALGRALAPLRDEGVLIIGSGLSFHNLALLGAAGGAPSAAFDAWLQDVLVTGDPARRAERLLVWETAPGARTSHPRADHLLPLMVATGAADAERGTCVYHEANALGGITASSFRFG